MKSLEDIKESTKAKINFLTSRLLDVSTTYVGLSQLGINKEMNSAAFYLMDNLGLVPGLLVSSAVAVPLVLHFSEKMDKNGGDLFLNYLSVAGYTMSISNFSLYFSYTFS